MVYNKVAIRYYYTYFMREQPINMANLQMQKAKPSFYNILIQDNKENIMFNSKNCALAIVNNQFLRILEQPNNITVDDIALREQMLKVGFLIDANIDEVAILECEHNQAKFDKSSLILTILPTIDCNFNCFYCFEHKKYGLLSSDHITKIKASVASKVSKLNKLTVCWFGGEPLLGQEIIWELSAFFLNLTSKNNCLYDAKMISNGYLITPATAKKIKEAHINSVQITIDGPPDMHNKRRCLKNGAGTFDDIIHGIELLCANDIRVGCRINIDKTNISTIKTLLEFLGEKNFNNFTITFGQILPLGNDDSWNTDVCFTIDEFSDVIESLIPILEKNNLAVINEYPFYPHPMLNFCGAEHANSLVIYPNGDLHKCYDCDEYKIGNVETGIASTDLEKHNMSFWLNNSPFKDDECKECKILPICMGGCPYLKVKLGHKICLKWKNDIETVIKRKAHINIQ